MQLLVLDFESFFDPQYSLKKLTTEAYVRDSRFKAHLVGIWRPQEYATPIIVEPDALHWNTELRRLISESAVLVHHGHFDGLVLSHHYGLKPAFWFDTLPMARLCLPRLRSHSLDSLAAHFELGAKTVPYDAFRGVRDLDPILYRELGSGCAHDIELTYSVWRRLLPLVPKDEFQVIDATIRLFTEPCLELDRPRMEAFLKDERLRKGKAMLEAGKAMGYMSPDFARLDPAAHAPMLRQYLKLVEDELQSSDKFKTALEALGYPCPMKWSDKQEKEIPALAKNDDGMQELLEHEDSRVQALAGARLGVKSTIDESRAERLVESSGRGPLPVYLSYAAAKTLRFGGGDKTNWQNFRRGGEIRKSIRAPKGHVLVIGDLSQIEYRLLLWLTGQLDKLQALANGVDLYCEYASKFYRETITKEDKPRRGVGKQGILMGGYGAGKGTMIATAASGGYGPPVYLSDDEGQRMVDLYREEHPMVKQFWRWCDSILPILASGGETTYRHVLRIANHKIHLPNGTAIDYTGLRWACNTEIFPDQQDDGQGYAWWEPTRKGWSRLWGSKVTADIIQSLACVVIKDVWVRMSRRHVRPVLQVHDELVYCVRTDHAERVEHGLHTEMKTPPAWCADIPLEAEVSVSENYSK